MIHLIRLLVCLALLAGASVYADDSAGGEPRIVVTGEAGANAVSTRDSIQTGASSLVSARIMPGNNSVYLSGETSVQVRSPLSYAYAGMGFTPIMMTRGRLRVNNTQEASAVSVFAGVSVIEVGYGDISIDYLPGKQPVISVSALQGSAALVPVAGSTAHGRVAVNEGETFILNCATMEYERGPLNTHILTYWLSAASCLSPPQQTQQEERQEIAINGYVYTSRGSAQVVEAPVVYTPQPTYQPFQSAYSAQTVSPTEYSPALYREQSIPIHMIPQTAAQPDMVPVSAVKTPGAVVSPLIATRTPGAMVSPLIATRTPLPGYSVLVPQQLPLTHRQMQVIEESRPQPSYQRPSAFQAQNYSIRPPAGIDEYDLTVEEAAVAAEKARIAAAAAAAAGGAGTGGNGYSGSAANTGAGTGANAAAGTGGAASAGGTAVGNSAAAASGAVKPAAVVHTLVPGMELSFQ